MSVTTIKGFIAGLFIGIILFILMALGFTGGGGVSYLKYAPLAVVLGIYLSNLSVERGDFHRYALIHGLRISAVAGFVLALANLIVFLMAPDLSVPKYNLVPTELSGALAISGALVFEVTVLGMILSFIFFQMFKNRSPETALRKLKL